MIPDGITKHEECVQMLFGKDFLSTENKYQVLETDVLSNVWDHAKLVCWGAIIHLSLFNPELLDPGMFVS